MTSAQLRQLPIGTRVMTTYASMRGFRGVIVALQQSKSIGHDTVATVRLDEAHRSWITKEHEAGHLHGLSEYNAAALTARFGAIYLEVDDPI